MHKILLIAVLLMLPLSHVGADEGDDLLLYRVSGMEDTEALMLYDPASNESTALSTDFSNVELSADGRIAYSINIGGDLEVHIWDSHHPDQRSISLMGVADAAQYPLAWSPDGHYLAFTSVIYADPNPPVLYIWDGATVVNITPPEVAASVLQYEGEAWSPDGRYFAFELTDENHNRRLYVWDGTTSIAAGDLPTDVYDYNLVWSSGDHLAVGLTSYDMSLPNLIYIWDGHNMMRLSQKPTQLPVWSADGQLAFQSERKEQYDRQYDILIWDGVSLKDGQPDANTFENVAPDLTAQYSSLAWTSQNQLAFSAKSAQDSHFQIYVWDGKTATNLSQNPTMNNSNPVWNADGHWVFMVDNSSQRFLYIRDADNHLLLTTKSRADSIPAWNSSGDLLFCIFDGDDWNLSVWDGKDVQGAYIFAHWQSGSSIICSTGGSE
jgi:hypothetical protein